MTKQHKWLRWEIALDVTNTNGQSVYGKALHYICEVCGKLRLFPKHISPGGPQELDFQITEPTTLMVQGRMVSIDAKGHDNDL